MAKWLHSVRAHIADTADWRQIRLVVQVPRDRSRPPSAALMLMHQRGRVPEVLWVESWESEVPLADSMDLEKVYEWLYGLLLDRLDV